MNATKRAAPESSPNTNIPQQYTANGIFDKARGAVKSLPKGQCKRAVLYLLTNSPATTVQIARICSIGKVSDCVAKVNPILRQHGLEIAHEYAGLMNQFGEISMMHTWWLQEVSE